MSDAALRAITGYKPTPEAEEVPPHLYDINEGSLLSWVEITGSREGLVEAMVPIDLIYQEDVPVDAGHVAGLAHSMDEEAKENGGTGQQSPVLLGEIREFGKFVTIDGFHRTPAMERRGQTHVWATIKPNTSWEKVIDLRILTAHMHRAVRFGRVVEWVRDAWDRSPWAEQVSSTQAFALAFNKTSTGKNIGLSPDETESIKAWVEDKCDAWHLSAVSIYNNLAVAKIADPGLVHEARERNSGRVLEVVTPQHLSAIAKELPGQYEVQRFVAKIATDNNLTVPKTRAVARVLSPAENMEGAVEIAASTDWNNLEPQFHISSQKRMRRMTRLALPLEVNPDTYSAGRLEEVLAAMQKLVLEGKVSPEDKKDLALRLQVIGKSCLTLASQLDSRPRSIVSVAVENEGPAERYARIQDRVLAYLKAEGDIEEVPAIMSSSDRRAFKLALTKAMDMDANDMPADWRDRFKRVQAFENTSLAGAYLEKR